MNEITVNPMKREDAETISSAFTKIGWNKPVSQYSKYFKEQQSGRRLVLLAFLNKKFAGYLTIVWETDYAPLKKRSIPEVKDLNVLPKFRRLGIGSKLMDKAEEIVSKKCNTIGIGVGLAPGYEAAQRMYVLRGYVPDGNGLTYNNKTLKYNEKVFANDDLVLHFLKQFKKK